MGCADQFFRIGTRGILKTRVEAVGVLFQRATLGRNSANGLMQSFS